MSDSQERPEPKRRLVPDPEHGGFVWTGETGECVISADEILAALAEYDQAQARFLDEKRRK